MEKSAENRPAYQYSDKEKEIVRIFGDTYDWCKNYEKYHRRLAIIFLLILVLIISLILISLVFLIIEPKQYENSKNLMYIFYIVATPIFGVCAGLYKFSLNEVTRNQHFHLGFKRMFLAGFSDQDQNGFGTEVRTALTSNAFPPFKNLQPEKEAINKAKAVLNKRIKPEGKNLE